MKNYFIIGYDQNGYSRIHTKSEISETLTTIKKAENYIKKHCSNDYEWRIKDGETCETVKTIIYNRNTLKFEKKQVNL